MPDLGRYSRQLGSFHGALERRNVHEMRQNNGSLARRKKKKKRAYL